MLYNYNYIHGSQFLNSIFNENHGWKAIIIYLHIRQIIKTRSEYVAIIVSNIKIVIPEGYSFLFILSALFYVTKCCLVINCMEQTFPSLKENT